MKRPTKSEVLAELRDLIQGVRDSNMERDGKVRDKSARKLIACLREAVRIVKGAVPNRAETVAERA